MIICPPIKDSSHIVKFCNPQIMDNNNFSRANFNLKKGEEYLSFDLLEFHNKKSFDENLNCSMNAILDRYCKNCIKLKKITMIKNIFLL